MQVCLRVTFFANELNGVVVLDIKHFPSELEVLQEGIKLLNESVSGMLDVLDHF